MKKRGGFGGKLRTKRIRIKERINKRKVREKKGNSSTLPRQTWVGSAP